MLVSSVHELEALLNSTDFVVGDEALWISLNERLGCFSERPPLRYTVRQWSECALPEINEPSVVLFRWDGTEYDIFLNQSFFATTVPPELFTLTRAFIIAIVLSFATKLGDKETGRCLFSLSDRGRPDMTSFTGRREEAKLIPDPVYVRTLAYERFRTAVNRNWIPWNDRYRTAIWRGALNGVTDYRPRNGWSWLPRAHLCATAASIDHREAIDAKLTGIGDFIKRQFAEQVSGLEQFFGNRIEPLNLLEYRYMVDIDGWANAWSGLFQKLTTGSVVLKVASQHGYRQWYYDRLEPWRHYIPVSADLSDLNEALEFVLSNDEEAETIGRAGRRLALSLNLEAELFAMSSVI